MLASLCSVKGKRGVEKCEHVSVVVIGLCLYKLSSLLSLKDPQIVPQICSRRRWSGEVSLCLAVIRLTTLHSHHTTNHHPSTVAGRRRPQHNHERPARLLQYCKDRPARSLLARCPSPASLPPSPPTCRPAPSQAALCHDQWKPSPGWQRARVQGEARGG